MKVARGIVDRKTMCKVQLFIARASPKTNQRAMRRAIELELLSVDDSQPRRLLLSSREIEIKLKLMLKNGSQGLCHVA